METNDPIADTRLMTHMGLIQIVFRSWGQPKEAVLANLRRSREALTADMLQKQFTDRQIKWAHMEFDIAIRSLESAIQDLPDDRPNPIG